MSIVLALAVAAGLHFAPDDPTVVQEPDRVVPLKKTVIDFTPAAIDAAITRPAGTVVVARPKTKFRNLIELRASFRPELAKSVGTLPGQ